MFDRKIMGRVIRRLRDEKGLSLEVLSGLAGMMRSQLGDVERGQRGMMLETFWRLAEALDMSPAELQAEIEKEDKS